MANDIAKIQEIGLVEVAKQTHIEVEYLEYMCNKDFESLKRLNALGFAKILSREYGIDLSSWCAEYNTYCEENVATGTKTCSVAPKIPAYTSRGMGIGWIIIIVVFAAFGALIFLASYTNYFDDFWGDSNRSDGYANTSVIKDAAYNLAANSNLNQDAKDENNNSAQVNSNQVLTPSSSTNNIQPQINAIAQDDLLQSQNSDVKTQSTNETDLNISTQDTLTKENLDINNSSKSAPTPLQAIIYPSKEIWIGTKSLTTNKKTSIITSKPYIIDLLNDALVVTGHGELVVYNGELNSTFTTKNSLKFLVKDGKIEQIPYSKYIELNKGKEW